MVQLVFESTPLSNELSAGARNAAYN